MRCRYCWRLSIGLVLAAAWQAWQACIIAGHKKSEASDGLGFFCARYSPSVPGVDTPAGAGLMDADSTELWQQGLEFLPDPLGQDFAGRILQARDIVQIVVIQALVQRLEDRLDLREVANPAGMRVDIAREMDGNLERVAMQAPALVPFGDVGQAMGGLESEFLEYFHGVLRSEK